MSDSTSTGRHDPWFGLATGPKLAELDRAARAAEAMMNSPAISLGLATGPKLAELDRALGMANAELQTALGPSFSPMMTDTLLGGLADIVNRGGLAAVSTIGVIDVDRMVEKFSTLARQGSADTSLDRERLRQLWGCYIYVRVWVVCLLLIIGAMTVSAIVFTLLGIGLSMTGWSGNSVASRARKVALDNFDRVYPPDRKASSITSEVFSARVNLAFPA